MCKVGNEAAYALQLAYIITDLDVGHIPEMKFTKVIASGNLRAIWGESNTVGFLPTLL